MRIAKLIAVVAIVAVALFTGFQSAESASSSCPEKAYFRVYEGTPGCPSSLSVAQIATRIRIQEATVRACAKMLKDDRMVTLTATGGFCRAGG
jgi:hypothetical protein